MTFVPKTRRFERGRRAPAITLRTAVAALLLLAALALAAVTAAPASAGIYDPGVEPAKSWTVDNAGRDDTAMDVAVNKGGAAYVCGIVTTAAGDFDGSLFKFPPSGAGWHKTWGGAAHRDDGFRAVAVGPDGSVYTAGNSKDAAGSLDMRLVKWSPAGAALWSRRYAGPVAGDDFAADVVVDRKGNVTVCGESRGRRGDAFTVVSWTSGGTRRWVRRIEGVGSSNDRAVAMVVDSSGNLYVTGGRGTEVGFAGYTVKLSAAGATKWSRLYDDGETVEITGMARRPGGGVYACGSTLTFDGKWLGLLMSYTAAGTRKVIAIDDGDGAESTDTRFEAVTATSTGKVAVAGSVSYGYDAYSCRKGVIYDAASGAVFMSLESTSSYDEGFRAVAADAYGGVYFTGTEANSDSHTRFWTERYPTVAGGAQWTGQHEVSTSLRDLPIAIATWRTTVWVVGVGCPGDGDADQIVLKYLY